MRRDIRNGHVTLRGLTYSTSKDGTRHYYLRGTPKIPLGRGPIDSPEFLARYAEAVKSKGKPHVRAKSGSIAGVIEAFQVSTHHASLSEGYRAVMRRHMDAIKDSYGTAPMASLEARHIRKDLAGLEAHPAGARLKAWRILCKLALDNGWSAIDAAAVVKPPATRKSDGHPVWTLDDIDAFRDRWPVGTVQRLCFELVYWTGARTIDAVRLSPSMVDAGVLEFVQSKTGGKAYVPWTCALPTWAHGFDADRAALMACLPRARFTYLETSEGKTRTKKGLSNAISDGARKAGVGKSAHGLRKARLTRIAEAGGSAHAIMSWGGHKTLSEAQEYIQTADRRRLVMSTPPAKVSTQGQ